MSRFKSARNPALTEAEKQQILKKIIDLKSLLNGYSTNLVIGSEDYRTVDRLGRDIMSAGETISQSPFFGQDMHRCGGK